MSDIMVLIYPHDLVQVISRNNGFSHTLEEFSKKEIIRTLKVIDRLDGSPFTISDSLYDDEVRKWAVNFVLINRPWLIQTGDQILI